MEGGDWGWEKGRSAEEKEGRGVAKSVGVRQDGVLRCMGRKSE